MCKSAAVFALALAFATSDARCADLRPLLRVYSALDNMCRGGAGDDPHTDQACAARMDASAALRADGVCLKGSGADAKWGHC